MSSPKVSYEGRMSYLHPATEEKKVPKKSKKFPKLSFSTVGYKVAFPPQPPRRGNLEGGAKFKVMFTTRSGAIIEPFDKANNTMVAAAEEQDSPIRLRLEAKLRAAGKSSEGLFRRENPEIAREKERLVNNSLREVEQMLADVKRAFTGLEIMHPQHYNGKFREKADMRLNALKGQIPTALFNQLRTSVANTYRTLRDLGSTEWVYRGVDNYVRLIRRLSTLYTNELDRLDTELNNLNNAKVAQREDDADTELRQAELILENQQREYEENIAERRAEEAKKREQRSRIYQKKEFEPSLAAGDEVEGGGFTRNFKAEYRELLFEFDARHHSGLFDATAIAANGIPARVEAELRAAGKSRPMFGRRNRVIEAEKQAIYDRGLADTRAMIVNARNILRNLIVLNPNQYGGYFETQALQLIPVTDMRTTIIVNRFIQQYRRFINGIGNDNGWINGGSDRYLALIRRLNDEVQNGLNQIVTMTGNIVAEPTLQYRNIPRGEVDGVTLEDIEDGDIMIDYDRNYSTNKYLKQSTVDTIPLRNEVLINPFTNAPALIIHEPYLARLVDTPVGGRLKCPICKKMVGKKH